MDDKANDKPIVDPVADTPAEDTKITHEEQAEKEADNFQMRQLGEPIADAYSEGVDEAVAAQKPAETIVEHPLAPTDTNPNPHGTRDEPFIAVATKNQDGGVDITSPDEGNVKVTATVGEVHLGDGRVLHEGGSAKVTKEVAKDLVDQGKVKRG